ncbi:nicotinate phosphoribosyltransferase [Candidatus Berkelbacteria bacterium]|nr:nicotinate phosphoribosyltransferase [Candidatus Berkelbacteria bacterium]
MNKNNNESQSIKDIPSILNTDLYNIRASERNWAQNFSEIEVHEMFFRIPPYKGNNFVIAVGMPYALRYLKSKLDESDSEWLLNQGFSKDFIDYLVKEGSNIFKDVNIWSVEEGTIMFPQEPIMRIEGPTVAVQLLETYFLSQVGYPTLIATKAIRSVWAAKQMGNNASLLEMGLRRSQTNSGHYGARAAYISGFSISSDSLAGKLFGIPVSGSSLMHADIQRRENEREAFKSFYEFVSYKNKVTFLIDTYNVIKGAQNAVEVAKEMRQNGHELFGVRIDSGNVKELIPEVKKIFSEASFPNVKIMLTGDMNEYKILDLAKNKVTPDFIGVGTELVTGGEKPALGMVYKLKGIKHGDEVISKIKISADKGKTTLPGSHQVFRVLDKKTGLLKHDVIGMYDEKIDGEPLLKQVVSNGNIIGEWETSDIDLTKTAKERAEAQIELLPDDVLNFEKENITVDVIISEKVKKHSEDLIKHHA